MIHSKRIEEAKKRGYIELGKGPFNAHGTGIINIVWFVPHKKSKVGDYSKYHTTWINDEIMIGYVELNGSKLIAVGASTDLSNGCLVTPFVSKNYKQSHEDWIAEIKTLI